MIYDCITWNSNTPTSLKSTVPHNKHGKTTCKSRKFRTDSNAIFLDGNQIGIITSTKTMKRKNQQRKYMKMSNSRHLPKSQFYCSNQVILSLQILRVFFKFFHVCQRVVFWNSETLNIWATKNFLSIYCLFNRDPGILIMVYYNPCITG